MRRRFGRRRGGRPSGPGRGSPIDAERWLRRIVDDGVVAATSLEPRAVEGVPSDFAAVGAGEAQDGTPIVIGFAPRSGGDAMLAALALATEPETSTASETEAGPAAAGFDGEVLAIAPQWSSASRRRLGMLGGLPFRFRALAASSLSDGEISVEPEPVEEPVFLRPDQVAAHLIRNEDRELFDRAAAALEGLASKHGGSVRAIGRAVELVLLSRRVAELRADDGGVVLNTILPARESARLAAGDLAGALDRLEGNLRRRLNDRRTLEGEEGLRARAIPLVARAVGLRGSVPWPLGGRDQDALDLAGVDAGGLPHVGAVREDFTLRDLAAVLDATALLQPILPHLLAAAGPPLRLEAPRLVLAARTFDAAVTRLLPLLAMGYALVEVRSDHGGLSVSLLDSAAGAPRSRPRREGRPQPERPAEVASPTTEPVAGDESAETVSEEGVEARGSARPARGRRRRGRRRGRGPEGADDASPAGREAEEPEPDDEEAPHFEEMSAFDLDEGVGPDQAGARGRRGRRRRGRRGGERGERGAPESDREASLPGGRGRRSTSRSVPETRDRVDSLDEDEEEAEGEVEAPEDLEEMVTELPDFDVYEAPQYEEDDDLGEESDSEEERMVLERERRRRARLAKTGPEKQAEPEEKPPPPRRRSAFVAHADRDSIMAAILLARDVRLIEGFWVYPQEELMTFFRSVATDLKEGTPIYLVGFQPKPARDVIPTLGLYGERVHWFDHHDWPPEDALALRQTIGEENVFWTPGAGSALPGVLSVSSRRSRFSDKLVDLATAHFSQHDYERWGRLWWWRLGDMAQNPGDRRRDIEPLLAGRPSDLAREAARSASPPRPVEIEFVASRDFRLVHFGGFALVVVDVPPDLDAHVCARVARERYGARLSVAYNPGSERVLLAGEDPGGRHALDLGAMVEHLASKLDWVESLPDDDHVARFRVRNLPGMPQRLDEVIAEIAMGRSILEG